jgi:putative lipoic acid-binding regulatory protein
MNDEAKQDRPDISYPCVWEYTVIGVGEDGMRHAVAAAVAECEHTVAPSNTSRTGKYCSLRLEVAVGDEAERDRIFQALAAHDEVTMVI